EDTHVTAPCRRSAVEGLPLPERGLLVARHRLEVHASDGDHGRTQHRVVGTHGCDCRAVIGQARSTRSRFMTLSHAATKSCTKVSRASSHEYTSERARNSECEPKTRPTAVAVHFTSPVARSRPS